MNRYDDTAGDDLRAVAGIKSTADARLLAKIETARKVYWALSVIVVIVSAVTIWVTTIRLEVDANDKAIRKLWEKVFEHPLP